MAYFTKGFRLRCCANWITKRCRHVRIQFHKLRQYVTSHSCLFIDKICKLVHNQSLTWTKWKRETPAQKKFDPIRTFSFSCVLSCCFESSFLFISRISATSTRAPPGGGIAVRLPPLPQPSSPCTRASRSFLSASLASRPVPWTQRRFSYSHRHYWLEKSLRSQMVCILFREI
jgi:hypothetical protein